MGYGTPTLDDLLSDDRRRISNLERAVYVYGDEENTNNPSLTITNLTGTISYYSLAGSGSRARIVWTWDAIPTPSPDDLTADPVIDYFISITQSGATATGPFLSTNGATTVTTDRHPPNSTVTARVYALTKKGLRGPVATATANVTKDSVPPNQPSTPTVVPALKGVLVTWNGLDSSAGVQPLDYSHTRIHASTTGGVTFTPSTANDSGLRFFGPGSLYIPGDANYTTINIRLVSVDLTGNESPASTGQAATPAKAVETDLGVVLPGDIAYSDINNLVMDGSFESPFVRASRLAHIASGTWTFDNTSGGAAFGDWFAKVTGDATTPKTWWIQDGVGQQLDEITAMPGTKIYLAARIKGVGANGSAQVNIQWRSQTNVLTTSTIQTTTSTGSWVLIEGAFAVPLDNKSFAINLQTASHTAGTWQFDTIQVRQVQPSVLIEDAAITNAKIANLAVNDAKIADLTVGKLTTGTMSATMTVSGQIVTATTGQRVAIDSTGISMYDASNNKLISIPVTGVPYFAGTLRSALSGARVEIGDSITLGGSVAGGVAFFYSGVAGETSPGQIYTTVFSTVPRTTIASPRKNSLDAAQINLIAQDSGSLAQVNGYVGTGEYFWDAADGYGAHRFRCGGVDFGIIHRNPPIGISIGNGNDTARFLIGTDSYAFVFPSTGIVDIQGSWQSEGGTFRITETAGTDRRLSGGLISGLEYVQSDTIYKRTGALASDLTINSLGTIFRVSSSERYKVNIDRTYGETVDVPKVLELTPASFYDKGDSEMYAEMLHREYHGKEYEGESLTMDQVAVFPKKHIGLIAEDVDELGLTDLVQYNDDGKPEGIHYSRIPVVLLPVLKEMYADIQELKRSNNG